MKNIREALRSQRATAALFAASAALILAGTVGGARAANPPYVATNDYLAEIAIDQVVPPTINENGAPAGDALLDDMFAEGMKPGKKYDETLSVTNSGGSDVYARVTLRKWWTGENGAETTLDPSLIELTFANEGDWQVDGASTTDERTVLYYAHLLPAGGTTSDFLSAVRISDKLPVLVTQTQEGNVITTTYDYQGVTLNLEAEVDFVQTHNAEDAILSAWGRKVSLSGTDISSIS